MDLTGKTLGKYKLIERLGQGGMAQVYKAFQPGVERHVAIKVMHSHLSQSPDFIERFQREARAVGQLQHSNILRIIDFDVENEMYYMVTEYIEGVTLESYLREKGGTLPNDEALRITEALANALVYAHERNMVHRDIKPANVMGSLERFDDVVLMDFGIARLMDEVSMTVSGSMVGTPAYMSPEGVQGKRLDERADIYSLGVLLYEMVTGRTPYVADTPFSLISKQLTEALPAPRDLNPELPAQINRLLLKALEKEPNNRFQTAKTFQNAIKHARLALGELSATEMKNLTPAAIQPTVVTSTSASPVSDSTDSIASPRLPIETEKSNRLWIVAGISTLVLLALAFAAIRALLNRTDDNNAALPTATTEIIVQAPIDTPQPIATNPSATSIANNPTLAPTSTILPPTPTPKPIFVNLPSGFIRFRDNEQANAGTIQLKLAYVPLPPAGGQYILQAQAEPNSIPISLGELTVNSNHEISFTAQTEVNLLNEFAVFHVAQENAGTIQPVFSALQVLDFVTGIRQLLFTGEDRGLLIGAQEQGWLAFEHSGFMQNALEAGDLPLAKKHAEHIVNILNGSDGENFGDFDGNELIENPGDNIGVINYLLLSQTIAENAILHSGDDFTGANLLSALDNSVIIWRAANELALKIFALDTTEEAQPFATDLQETIELMMSGADLDGDDQVDMLAGEGGIVSAYDLGVAWGTVPLFPIAQDRALQVEEGQQVVSAGILQISNTPNQAGGGYTFTMQNAPLPPVNHHYQLWLLHDDGTPQNLGSPHMGADRTLRLTGELEHQILGDHNQLVLSVEPDGETATIPRQIRFSGSFALNTLPILRDLMVDDGVGTGFLVRGEAQLATAIQHAGFALDAGNVGNYAGILQHTEHTLNLLVGSQHELFGDLNEDGQAQNPGDGFGVLGYGTESQAQLADLVTAGTLAPAQQKDAGIALSAIARSNQSVVQAIEIAQQIFATDNAEEAKPLLTQLNQLLTAIQNGVDENEDGVIDPLLSEGGWDSAVRFTLNSAGIHLNSTAPK